MSRPEPPSRPRSRRARGGTSLTRLAAALLLAAAAPAVAAGPYLVHDLGVEVDYPWAFSGLASQQVEMNGALYFFHDDGVHGHELWRSDGTALGTFLVRDLCPGICGTDAYRALGAIAAVGSTLLFTAHDGVHGQELWATDGTAGGARLVADLRPGLASSAPRGFLAAAGQLFFVADDGVHGAELWRSDGTVEGTHLVLDLAPGPEPGGIGALELGAGHLFVAVLGPEERAGLWLSDGTAAGTVRIAALQLENAEAGWIAYCRFRVLHDGTLLFTVRQPNDAVELWRSDGTSGGTFFLRQVGYSGSKLAIVGGAGYIVGVDTGSDGELVRTDGTLAGTGLVPLPPGASPSLGHLASSVAGRLLLAVYEESTGYEPWIVDGLSATPLADLYPGPLSSTGGFGAFSAVAGDEVVFLASDGSGAGSELWATDLTAPGTRRISDLATGAEEPGLPYSMSALPPVALGGGLLVPTWDAAAGVRLWRADPVAGTTTSVRQIGSQTSNLRPPYEFNIFSSMRPTSCMEVVEERLLFEARASWWYEPARLVLVSTDGAVGGLEVLREAAWESLSCSANGPHAVVHYATPFSPERWFTHTDGLPEGTSVPFSPGTGEDGTTWNPPAVPFGDGWLLGTGEGLWESDGTPGGSVLVDPDPAGAGWGVIASSALGAVYGAGGSLRFLAPGLAPVALAEESLSRWVDWIVPTATGFAVVVTEEGFGTELWWTDGTPAGTGRVRDIAPGPASSIRIGSPIEDSFEPRIAGKLAALGGRVVFAADDGVHGEELWVSDGTEAGTFLLGDLMPGPAPSTPRDLTSAGERLFFAAEHPALGRELWVTDGTPAGTGPVADLVPGAGSSRPGDLAWLGDRLVFSAWTPAWGREAWRTDGTAAGTWRLTDIAPGPASASPGLFREVGGTLLFAANDGVRGFELWGLTADGSVPLFRDAFESGGLQRWDEGTP